MIAMVPVIAAAQFGTDVGLAVDLNTRFEVVAIKAFDDVGGRLMNRVTPGGFESNLPVGMHLRQALQKPDYRIFGAPGWIDAERYAINAKKPEGLPPAAQAITL